MQDGLKVGLAGLCHPKEARQDKKGDHTLQGRGEKAEEAGARE